jgi:hypothetical protein
VPAELANEADSARLTESHKSSVGSEPKQDPRTKVELSNQGLTDAEASAMAEALAKARPRLTTIDLHANQFHDVSPLPLTGLPEATTLNLFDNGLTDKVVPALVGFLTSSPKLTSVNFFQNKFSKKACARLKAAKPNGVANQFWHCEGYR